MKKIDLHIHTVSTVFDAPFTFALSALERYVSAAALDAIALTNHNIFDRAQFAEITASLDTAVFPGIEVTLDCGHVLIISDVAHLDLLSGKLSKSTNGSRSPRIASQSMSFLGYSAILQSTLSSRTTTRSRRSRAERLSG